MPYTLQKEKCQCLQVQCIGIQIGSKSLLLWTWYLRNKYQYQYSGINTALYTMHYKHNGLKVGPMPSFQTLPLIAQKKKQKSLNQVRISYSSQSSILIHKIPPNEVKNVHPVQQLQCKLMLLIDEKYFNFSNYQLSHNDINRVENPIVYNMDWTVSCVIGIFNSQTWEWDSALHT